MQYCTNFFLLIQLYLCTHTLTHTGQYFVCTHIHIRTHKYRQTHIYFMYICYSMSCSANTV